jgi:predicted membrane-bound spermidine synthase
MPARRSFSAVFFVAAALIVLQVSFTRLISYKLFYHFVFLAIALSLLGLGTAGTYVAVRKSTVDLDSVIRRWLCFGALLTPIAFLAMANPPIVSHTELVVKLLGNDALKYLALCAVFMVALNLAGGVVLTQAFKTHSDQMGKLYACDLVGAAFGCLWSVALMKYLSPPVAFLSAGILFLCALVPTLIEQARPRERAVTAAVGALALAATVGVLIGPQKYRSFDNMKRGPERAGLDVYKFERYEWNHIIRTNQGYGNYVLDGEASTPMVRWDQNQQAAPARDPSYRIVKPNPRVAIIGFGGGPQVSEARRAQASSITAIDINPSIARWVQYEDRDYNLGLFMAPNIEVVNGEGRHTIRQRQKNKFDVIIMHAIDTYAATAGGAYSLSENFLYTKEAMFDYLGALNPGGVMSIQRWLFNPPRENLRLFATALQAFEDLGYKDPLRHVIMIAPTNNWDFLRLGKLRIWGYLLISPTPFSDAQVATTRQYLQALGWTPLYTPGGNENTQFVQYAKSPDRDAFRETYPYVITPVTDASPYLFQYYSPLSRNAYRMEGDWAVSGIYQSSAITLLSSLGISILLSFLLIIAPLIWASLRAERAGTAVERLGAREVVYFGCLGVGFMALEVPLTQLLSLYLGHPVYGFSVVLVALLLSSGVGSLLSARLAHPRWKVCALIALSLLVTAIVILPFVHGSIQLPGPLRFGLALVLVALLGLPMGFPLALAVREIGGKNEQNVAWAWGVNGAASVVGSCLVMIVMVFLETRFALVLGAACYALAALMSRRPAPV